jgi:hypothetical protein
VQADTGNPFYKKPWQGLIIDCHLRFQAIVIGKISIVLPAAGMTSLFTAVDELNRSLALGSMRA